MSADNIAFFIVGILAISLGFTLVLKLVRGELAQASGIRRHSRIILALAIGMGVIAFTLKFVTFLIMATFDKKVIEPLMVERSFMDLFPAEWRQLVKQPEKAEPYQWKALPTQAPSPMNNPTTPEKVALGRELFFDRNLSITRDVACASCHDVDGGTGIDGGKTSTGIKGLVGGRNAPTVWNAAFQAVLFWDGRAASLEDQAKGPPLNPIEMGMPSGEDVAKRVQENQKYRPMFDKVFGSGTEITFDRIAQAIAAYERTLITPDSPYDRFVQGEKTALTEAQLRGMVLFQNTGCVSCHSGPNFSGASFLNNGSERYAAGTQGENGYFRMFPANDTPYVDRYKLLEDTGAAPPHSPQGIWRVPSLRNVAITGPYLHNGSVDNLEEVVKIMATSQLNAVVSENKQAGRKVFWSDKDSSVSTVERPVLSDADVKDIAEFLRSLTSESLAARVALKKANAMKVAKR